MTDVPPRRHLFISYSRVDRVWVDRLRQVMAPLLREADGAMQLWDDSQIRPGAQWREEIEAALAGAQVALLLVSAEFLASEFVMRRELPELLAAAQRDGVRILWVNLSPSLVQHTPIHAYQAVLPPEPCLAAMAEVEQRRALTRIAEEVHRALQEGAERQRQLEEQARQRQLEHEHEQEQARQAEALQAEATERARVQAQLQAEAEQRRQAEQARQAEAAERARVQAQRQAEAEQRRREEQARQAERRQPRMEPLRSQPPASELEGRRVQERWQPPALALLQDLRRRGSGLSRRELLLGAAGLPLLAAGAAALRSLLQRAEPSLRQRRPPGPYPFTTSEGRLQRDGDAWQVLTSPIQVAMHREPLAPGLDLRLIDIPAGSFTMGSPPGEPERSTDEGPQHQVRLQGFLLGQTPITQAQWRVVAGWPQVSLGLKPNPSFFQGDDRPVEHVSWLEAIEFCRRLSQRTGRTYTLPSEAQWEYACRAGTTTPFHFGATISPEVANYDGTYSYADGATGVYRQQTTPVGMFPANAWGLQDLHGNVWEWCLDHWHQNYEGAPMDGSAWLDGEWPLIGRYSQKDRLLRGGSWFNDPGSCRSAFRLHLRPDLANDDVGFRVVCLPQGPSLNP